VHILIADDVPVNLKLLELFCQRAGHTTRCVLDGAAALEEVMRGGVDLVLMDIMMPEMNGIEATRRIRALPAPLCRTLIIAVTANASRENREACLDAGVDVFMPKPIRQEELTNRIAALVKGGAGPG
jgi:CheY-like chemotaxis protein